MSELSAAANRVQRFTLSTSFDLLGRPAASSPTPRSNDPGALLEGDYLGPPTGGTIAPSAYSICRMPRKRPLSLAMARLLKHSWT
jgi:hypothetical protein